MLCILAQLEAKRFLLEEVGDLILGWWTHRRSLHSEGIASDMIDAAYLYKM